MVIKKEAKNFNIEPPNKFSVKVKETKPREYDEPQEKSVEYKQGYKQALIDIQKVITDKLEQL